MLSLLCVDVLALHTPRIALARRPALVHHRSRTWGLRLCTDASVPQPLFVVLQVALARAVEREERKRISLEKEAVAATKAEQLGRWATLVTSNLYRIPADATSVVVEDWEQDGKEVTLTFDSKIGSPQLEAEKAFAAARRLRRGSAVISGLLEDSERTRASLGEWQARLQQSAEDPHALSALQTQLVKRAKRLNLKLPELQPSAEPKQKTKAAAPRAKPGGWTGRVFESPAGVPILVGRNRQENEELSLRVAREPDVWMHVRDSPGAHVVLQLSQASTAARKATGDECLQLAADLAVFYSEMRSAGKASVSVTSPKHITKPRGAPLGAVRIRSEGPSLVGVPDNVPEELKALREQHERQAWGKS